MRLDVYNAFLSAALDRGLIHPNHYCPDKHFFYQLAYSSVCGPTDPEKVRELVDVAQQVSAHTDIGVHRILLTSSVRRRDLENHRVIWNHASPQSDQDRRLTLEEWLIEQGFEYTEPIAA